MAKGNPFAGMAKAEKADKAFDKKNKIKEGSKKDNKIDKAKGLPADGKKKGGFMPFGKGK